MIANWGINLNDSAITKLKDAVDDQDAVNLRTLNKKIDEIPSGGGGDGGPVSNLVDENGVIRVDAKTNGYETTVYIFQNRNKESIFPSILQLLAIKQIG